MYKAAEYFSESARRKVAAESVFTSKAGNVMGDHNDRCVIGALLVAEGLREPQRGSTFSYPKARQVRELLRDKGRPLPPAGALPELMKANDRGELSTPEAVRDALGV